MAYIDLFYGLSFFSLGLVVALETFRPITPEIKPAFRSLAAFGFLYGIHQWIKFGIETSSDITFLIVTIDVVLMTMAAIFLARFGGLLISDKKSFVRALPILLALIWLALVISNINKVSQPHEFHHMADTFARYIVIIPANIMTAWGIVRGKLIAKLEDARIQKDRVILATLFVANAFFSGVIVHANSVAPARWLNDQIFINTTGVQVELIRALLAVAITVFMVAMLRVFEYEFLEERQAKEALEHDAVVAAEIQNELLPSLPLVTKGARIFARLVQARIVGGDTFDYYKSHNDRAVFMIADASGKGSPAALLCMAGLITMETESTTSESPKKILAQANKRLAKRFPTGSFITAAMGRYFPEDGIVEMASCGQNPPLIYRKKEHCWRVVDLPGSLPMGVEDEVEPSEIIIGVKPGDRLLMYTDGLIDMRNAQGEKVSFESIINWLNAQADLGPSEILDHLIDLVLSISGAKLYDDITVLLVNFENIESSGAEKAA